MVLDILSRLTLCNSVNAILHQSHGCAKPGKAYANDVFWERVWPVKDFPLYPVLLKSCELLLQLVSYSNQPFWVVVVLQTSESFTICVEICVSLLYKLHREPD